MDNANACGNSGALEKQSWLALLNRNLFAFRSPTHFALNQNECANHSRFPFTNDIWRVRGCLTLMPSQPANAVCCRAPARHLGFTNVIPGVPFATPRVRWTPQVIERLSRIPTVKRWRMVLGAGSGMKTVKRMSATLDKTRKLAPAAPGDGFDEMFPF